MVPSDWKNVPVRSIAPAVVYVATLPLMFAYSCRFATEVEEPVLGVVTGVTGVAVDVARAVEPGFVVHPTRAGNTHIDRRAKFIRIGEPA